MNQEGIQTDFMDDLKSSLHVKADYESKVLNYTWVDLFEEVIPYIDNILRNPKRFIINEEEIVQVEKSKKVTVESVIHLTQHTNYIEKYDEDTGEVRPSKILNVNKEESLDTYENRFIHTLVKNMDLFYQRHAKALEEGSYSSDSKEAEYEAETTVGTEVIKMSVKYKSFDRTKEDCSTNDEGKQTENIVTRLRNIKIRMDGFNGTELMQNLDRLHVPAVTSPIKKTNTILKNPNFQKATQLWNFIQSYVNDDEKLEKDHKDYMDNGDILEQFNQSFMFDYLALSSLSKKTTIAKEKKAISMALAKVIENILDIDDELLVSKAREVFTDEFNVAQKKVQERNSKIVKIFNEKMENYNKSIENAISKLEIEV